MKGLRKACGRWVMKLGVRMIFAGRWMIRFGAGI